MFLNGLVFISHDAWGWVGVCQHDEAEQEMVEVESKLIESLKQLTILSVFGLVLCLVAPFTTSK